MNRTFEIQICGILTYQPTRAEIAPPPLVQRGIKSDSQSLCNSDLWNTEIPTDMSIGGSRIFGKRIAPSHDYFCQPFGPEMGLRPKNGIKYLLVVKFPDQRGRGLQPSP